ncbi:T9SS type A sorting domain-containing protein [Carboxylicivirga sp. N1Y90]|uniref:T9SS type A sorting domain-containing protein n=1 Tax=Carboxylicivirga fragile TaxID=3417571 RepID=UPI003D34F753|nr:T9SS type A sorting domain-containing protein [Marinilabiliaceae bacterium N1Y90]
MKKFLLLGIVLFYVGVVFAQEVEIFYPDLQYDTNKGFTKNHVLIGSAEADLWKRGTTGLPAESELGYTRTGNQTMLSSKGYGGVDAAYDITDTYAVIDAVDLSVHPQSKHFKLTFFNKAQYALANNSVFTVLLSENYAGDPTTATWTDVTSQVDKFDDDVTYDGNWTKSTLNLNSWKAATNLVLAFRYQVTQAGVVDKTEPGVDRPGLWRVCEVRFTYSDTPTAIGDVEIDGALFSPNPAYSVINLSERVDAVEIYNINGGKVKSINNINGMVDVSELQSGVYFLQMKLDSGVIKTAKMLKK